MRISDRRPRLAALGLALSFALVATACGDDDDTETATTEAAGEATTTEGGATTTRAAATTTSGGATTTSGGATTTRAGATTTAAGATTTAASGAGGGGAGTPAPCTQGDVGTVGLAYDAVGRGDGSFNDSAAAGLDRAKTALGVDANEQVPAADNASRAETLDLLANQDFNPVIAVGFLFSDPLGQVATEYPDVCFGIIDSVVEADNVAGLVFAANQGSFLVGAAAGLKTETDNVGFVGGLEGELIREFEAGYTAGVEAANPGAEVQVQYIGTTVDAFSDPARGKEIARGMIDNGADIIYAAAGASGLGVFDAVREANEAGNRVWAIGVDSDQGSLDNAGVPDEVKPYILTSMLKRVDVAVEETINAVNEGTFAAGPQVFDLEAEGVGYSTTGGNIDDIVPQLDAFEEQIISGQIEVPTTP